MPTFLRVINFFPKNDFYFLFFCPLFIVWRHGKAIFFTFSLTRLQTFFFLDKVTHVYLSDCLCILMTAGVDISVESMWSFLQGFSYNRRQKYLICSPYIVICGREFVVKLALRHKIRSLKISKTQKTSAFHLCHFIMSKLRHGRGAGIVPTAWKTFDILLFKCLTDHFPSTWDSFLPEPYPLYL